MIISPLCFKCEQPITPEQLATAKMGMRPGRAPWHPPAGRSRADVPAKTRAIRGTDQSYDGKGGYRHAKGDCKRSDIEAKQQRDNERNTALQRRQADAHRAWLDEQTGVSAPPLDRPSG